MRMTSTIDFSAINQAALASPSYLERLLPDSHMEGHRLHADNLNGGEGRSFNLNTETGAWFDQSTDEKGGDVISLVAAQKGIGQGEAAKQIADDLHLSNFKPAKIARKELPECPLDWNNPTFVFSYYKPVSGASFPIHCFDVLRWEVPGYKKAIRQSLGRDENKRRIRHAKGAEMIPFNLCGIEGYGVAGVTRSNSVVIVEGENKVIALAELGICGSCCPGGAGKWKQEYNHWFTGKDIVVLPDNDEPGRKHAQDVARNLHGVAASVKVCELHGLPEKGDIVDWLEMPGNDKEGLRALMNDAPLWEDVKDGLVEEGSTDSLGILSSPPPVPLEAFPESIQNLIVEAADAYGAPQQIPTACLLSILSCFVGRTRAIEAKQGWYEHGNTWIIVVGPSGVGKTPISDAFYKALNGLEYKMFQKWKAEQKEYVQAMFDFNKTKKKDRGYPPVMPGRTQYYVDDSTLEAVAEALDQNPRGILWRTDELAGMLADFDKYSKTGKTGSTRSRLLSSYDCQPWKSNRRDALRNTLIPAACVSIFGGIQPGMMPRVFDGEDEECGFLPRFLFIRAEQEKPALWSERTLSTESMELLKTITERLAAFKLKVSDSEGYSPYRVELSEGAKAAYVEWHNALAMEGWAALNEKKSNSINQKFKSHALRLCLLLHCLDAALADKDGLNFIQEDTMRRALLLADWAREHQAQVWKMFSGENAARSGSPLERAIMSSVVADEEQIRADNGRIANKRLVELVNSFLPCPVDSRIIGKAATSLGLAPCYIGSTRARHVPLEKIDMYKTNVGHVGNVGCPTATRADATDMRKTPCRSCR